MHDRHYENISYIKSFGVPAKCVVFHGSDLGQ